MMRCAMKPERPEEWSVGHPPVTPVLPITGADIMEAFGIPPGPRIGELLDRARRIYESKPCGREALLAEL